MRRRLRELALLAATAAVAACTGAAPAVPGSSSQPTGGLPTTGATQGPGATNPAGSPVARPTRVPGVIETFHAVPDLEAKLPRKAGDAELKVESVVGPTFGTAGRRHRLGLRCHFYEGRGVRCRRQQQLSDLVTRVGATPESVSIAFAFEGTRRPRAEVQATRLAGSDAAKLVEAYVAIERERYAKRQSQLAIRTETLGSKNVTVLESRGGRPNQRVRYVYASGDTLYEIRLATRPVAEEILKTLA